MQARLRVLLAVAATLAAALALTFVRTNTSHAGKGVMWRYDFKAAAREAAKTKKPIMIDFYADWCGWCKKLDREVYTDSKVIEASRKFVALKIDTDKDENTARKYDIEGLPTIVFLKPNTKEISRVVGYRPAKQFLNEMNKALAAAKGK